jgi:transcriptional regulator with XRE-family HTH domain
MSELPPGDGLDQSARVGPRVTKEKAAIGARIRELREARGLTQDELATKLDLKSQQVWRYEHGWNKPSGSTVVELAEALGTSPRHIMYGEVKETQPVDEVTDTAGWLRFVELGLFERYLEKGLDRGQLDFIRGARFKAGPPTGPEPYVELAETLLKTPVTKSASEALREAREERARKKKR